MDKEFFTNDHKHTLVFMDLETFNVNLNFFSETDKIILADKAIIDCLALINPKMIQIMYNLICCILKYDINYDPNYQNHIFH